MNRYLFNFLFFTPYILLIAINMGDVVTTSFAVNSMAFLILIYCPILYYLRVKYLKVNNEKKYWIPFYRLLFLKEIFFK